VSGLFLLVKNEGVISKMTTQGFSSNGSTVVFDSITLGECESFNLGEDTAEFEEIFTVDSTDYYSDVIITALNAGTLSMTFIMQPNNTTGNYAKLKAKFDARTKGTFLWTFLNTAYFTGTVAIVGLSRPDGDAKKANRFTATFKTAGAMSYVGT